MIPVKFVTIFVLCLISMIPSESQTIFNSSRFLPVMQRPMSSDDTLYENPPPCSETTPTICVGCRSIKICVGLPEPNNPIENCRPDTPYCNSLEQKCSTVVDNSQAQCSTDDGGLPPQPEVRFLCSGEGRFPDPYSCDGYYYCADSGSIGDYYQCPPRYRYNSKVQLCQWQLLHLRQDLCKPLSCSITEATFKPYPYDPKYYYLCQYDPAKPTQDPQILMMACENGAEFDSATLKCAYKCSQEGLFVKTTNRNRYFQCYRVNKWQLTYIERTCPFPAQEFDDEKKVCVLDLKFLMRKNALSKKI